MAKRGRKPKPAGLRKLQGNPGKRPLPQPLAIEAGKLVPPEHLDAAAIAEWERVLPVLSAVELAKPIDRAALAALCQVYARWAQAETEVRALGPIVKSPSGYPIQNPWLAVANKAMTQMLKIMAEFGMTPSSRTRVKPEAPPPLDDPMDTFLARKEPQRAQEKEDDE